MNRIIFASRMLGIRRQAYRQVINIGLYSHGSSCIGTRFTSTGERNKSILEKLQDQHKVVRRRPKSEADASSGLGEFTDNESYQKHVLESSIEQQYDYLRFEDPSQSDIARAIYRKLQPITPNDSYVSCTTFDSKGNVVAVSRRYPKLKFLKENNLFPRDLRKIDTSSIDVVPLIMVRGDNSILINLLHIKAIIKKDRVMIFDTSNQLIAKKLGLFMYDLEMKLKTPVVVNGSAGTLCYEFRALESVLISVMSFLDSELKTHLATCGSILDELEDQIDRNKLRELLIKLKLLASFYQKALLIRDVLDEILESDEDLASMYLSEPKHYDKNVENPTDYQDLEMLLESYYNHCDEFVQRSGSLINDIKATEEIVNIILDANRNSLMLFELKVTVYTLGFTVATLVPAFYGMNLKNYIEDSELGFASVVLFSIIQGVIVTSYMFKRLQSVQRLTMMGGASMAPMKQKSNKLQVAHLAPKWLIQEPNIQKQKQQQKIQQKLQIQQSKVESARNSRFRFRNPWFSKRFPNRKRTWYNKWIYGDRNTKFDRPTSTEKDVIWRMINDDKPMK